MEQFVFLSDLDTKSGRQNHNRRPYGAGRSAGYRFERSTRPFSKASASEASRSLSAFLRISSMVLFSVF
ncbi:MAG: hypothetical protein DWH82_00150 [Planctomycetota bacterium]|nr:MAG: hypothetical protein DWH82_00150 [Planctomycetota bacterium]